MRALLLVIVLLGAPATAWAETYTGHFLDAYLKSDPAGLSFVQAKRPPATAPAHMLTLNSHLSSGAPPTREAFAAQLAKSDFGQVQADYQTFKTRAPDFNLSEDEINNWGYRLLVSARPKAAASILELGTQLYPESSGMFDSLGEVYAKGGEKAKAIDAYRKSLKLDPRNSNAAAQLKVLGATAEALPG